MTHKLILLKQEGLFGESSWRAECSCKHYRSKWYSDGITVYDGGRPEGIGPSTRAERAWRIHKSQVEAAERYARRWSVQPGLPPRGPALSPGEDKGEWDEVNHPHAVA